MNFDLVDQTLIMLLQHNAKLTTKQLAVKLHLSKTAVYERIKKLEKQGVISNYVAVIDKERIDRSFVVLCHIKLIQHSHEYLTKFENDVVKLDEVLECYNVSGEYDYILKVVVKNMKAYRDFINTKLTRLNYIGSTHSTFIISELKNTNVIAV